MKPAPAFTEIKGEFPRPVQWTSLSHKVSLHFSFILEKDIPLSPYSSCLQSVKDSKTVMMKNRGDRKEPRRHVKGLLCTCLCSCYTEQQLHPSVC